MSEISDETLSRVFSRLKPFSVDLLDLLRDPRKDASFLAEMASFFHRTPPNALHPFLDFTLFPLLLLLDASVKCRSEKRSDFGEPFGGVVISDYVAENMLACLEEILNKCHLGSVNQMVVVMKKLTNGALLSPSEAAEEFREGIIRCLRAMLVGLQPCSAASCSCKQISSLSTALIQTLRPHHISKQFADGECLVAFLQSQDASAAVGHLLSLFLQIAEVEAARGYLGSGRLRKEAFLSLRVLVARVGTADALAYFLPGIVSRFSKCLYVTKSMISGAAGHAASIEQAVRGLTEFLMIVLSDEANRYGLEAFYSDANGFSSNSSSTTQAVLDALRLLPVVSQAQSENIAETSLSQSMMISSSNCEIQEKASKGNTMFLHVDRSKEWTNETSANVDKMLSATFPHLSMHPSEKVRKGLVEGVRGLLSNCSYTLRRSKLMLLECLFLMVSDDSEVVSFAALHSLEFLFMSGKRILSETEVSDIFTRLIGKLPILVLGSDETAAVTHARKLLALMYYAGPEVVVDQLLCSPVKAARFLENLALAIGHNSQYAGSVNKLVLSKPLSAGYLLSISELKAASVFGYSSNHVANTPFAAPKITFVQDRSSENSAGSSHGDSDFRRMPPWFVYNNSKKLYQSLAGMLRLVGLSIMADHRSEVSLLGIIGIPLDYIRKLISEVRMKEYNKFGWQMWYSQSASGQLLRQTSTAVCILNEIICGLSDQSVGFFLNIFGKTGTQGEKAQTKDSTSNKLDDFQYNKSVWKLSQEKDVRNDVIHCIGNVLHEYLSPEVWSLPIDQNSLLEHAEATLSLHFFRDVTMLHQVIIEGIGVISMFLGRDFVSSGFMHSCLYLLLQNLISSNYQIRSAADDVLQLLCVTSGYATVGHLVVANADYIIDSLCRQLRHLDLNPDVPDVLAAMLSYIGAAHDILPLLEEPMRTVSLELEVLGRHHHPNLTIPFLKALGEITKASMHEASKLPNEAELFYQHVDYKFCRMQNRANVNDTQDASEKSCVDTSDVDMQCEQWEELLFRLNEIRRYRRIVGSLVGSCLNAATPLLGSVMESACLEALYITEDATVALAKVEEAYKHEKETKAAIEKAIQLCSLNDFQDTIDAADDADENRLLPAMNKIWPYLVICLKNKVSVAVIKKCTSVLSRVIQISGGDFFVRRLHNDGPIIWKMLASSPFRAKPLPAKDKKPILLPYRSTSLSVDPMAETSSLKIQAAVLNMIAEISGNKRSAPAIERVLKKVSGLVVGIACSSVTGLRDAALKALSGLASIDQDLIWLLLADVYYNVKNKNIPPTPISDLPLISELLPTPASSKEYLYVKYGGEGLGFDIDPLSVEIVFQKMQSEVFTG